MAPISVIGIDPGSIRTGWGIVDENSGRLVLRECGIIRTPGDSLNFSDRLAEIYRQLSQVIERHDPGEAAVEQIFIAKNVKSTLKLGQARGAAIAACAGFDLPIFDYEPTVVKKSLVGTGQAQKEQVAFMVKRLLNVQIDSWPLDTTDAIAVAICHLNQRRFLMATGKMPALK